MQNKYISVGFTNILYLIIILNLFACKQAGDQNAIYNISKSVTSDSAMVASAHPLATSVGIEILRQGGNAIDAAIAVQFALAVGYPGAGNIGGGGFLVYRSKDGEISTLDYREKAASLATPDMYLDSLGKKGCIPVCATFSLSSNLVVASADWNLGDGNSESGVTSINHCYTSAGVYTLTAMFVDLNGCNGYATSTVEVVPAPVADFNSAPLKPIINQDQIVTFTDASHNGNIVSWNWFFMNNASATSNMQNPTYMYTEPGTYAVALVVKNDAGCTDTLVRPLVLGEDFGIYVPNAFTPDGDGLNDVFLPLGVGWDLPTFDMMIFDR